MADAVFSFFLLGFLMDEGQEGTLRKRRYDNIAQQQDGYCDERFQKIGCPQEVHEQYDGFVFQVEDINVRKRNLVEDDEAQINCPQQRGKKIEFFNACFLYSLIQLS